LSRSSGFDRISRFAECRRRDRVAVVEGLVDCALKACQIRLCHAVLRYALLRNRQLCWFWAFEIARTLFQAIFGVNRACATGRRGLGTLMTPVEKTGYTPLPHSDEDLERVKAVPDTPQTRAPTYRLAWNDPDFMTQRDLASRAPAT
jgi:hypothetical protein